MLSTYLLVQAIQEDWRREELRLARLRAFHESQIRRSTWSTRLRTWVLSVIRPDHSLTDYPCRLPDGTLGRVAVVRADGDWTLVCRVA